MSKSIFNIPEILIHIAKHLSPADLARACRVLEPTNFSILKRVLESNPAIKELSLTLRIYAADVQQTAKLIRVITGMRMMKKLALKNFKVLPRTIEYLLEQLPDMQLLSLTCWEEFLPDLDVDSTAGIIMPTSTNGAAASAEAMAKAKLERHTNQQERQSQLRYFHLEDCKDDYSYLFRVTRFCPLLEHLSHLEGYHSQSSLRTSREMEEFYQHLKVHCPRLSEFRLRCYYWNSSIDLEGLEYLILLFPTLKLLDIHSRCTRKEEILATIIRLEFLHESLEDIRLVDFDRVPNVATSTLILTLLGTMKQLKRFSMPLGAIDSMEMVRHTGTFDGVFACRELEVLEVPIIGPDADWAPRCVYSVNDIPPNDRYDALRDFGFIDQDESEPCPPSSPRPASYELYDAVMEQLDTLPMLDKSTVRFRYKNCWNL
ncbi:hypothetical protein BGZ54_002225 [Gamsiella multidivaricata]|nr:hypothetical protein BGZ54_002225 [Gamsiella multidivaricata]